MLKIINRLYNGIPVWFTAIKLLMADMGTKDAIFFGKRGMAVKELGSLWFDMMVAALFSL